MLYPELQFGSELEFFKKMVSTGQPGPEEDGKKTTQYIIEIGSTRFVMLTISSPRERPLAVGRAVGDKGEVFIYSAYEEVPFDPKLFASRTVSRFPKPSPDSAEKGQPVLVLAPVILLVSHESENATRPARRQEECRSPQNRAGGSPDTVWPVYDLWFSGPGQK